MITFINDLMKTEEKGAGESKTDKVSWQCPWCGLIHHYVPRLIMKDETIILESPMPSAIAAIKTLNSYYECDGCSNLSKISLLNDKRFGFNRD